MDNSQFFTEQLNQFKGIVSDAALSVFQTMPATKPVQIILAGKRRSKYGDFRVHKHKGTYQITVNGGMNSDATAFILAHEIAHFLVFVNQTKREAHGLIWKKTFRELLMQMISNKAFTEAVTSEISRYIHNPTATIRRNSRLYKELFGDESAENGTVALMDIAAGSRFTIGKSLKTYEKLDKRRTRYVCRCLQNKRLYLVSQHLMVNTLE